MKKIFLLVTLFIAMLIPVKAEEMLTAEVQFDWLDISQLQRDTRIDCYRSELFDANQHEKYIGEEFKQKFLDYQKDAERNKHYIKAKADIKEIEDANLCAFYYKKDILLIYAVQYKNNPRNIFYYDAFGKLRYLDDISANYPDYPYTSIQYTKSGRMVSAIYFESQDVQYMYEPNGKFKGVWYKDKMYDKSGNQTLTRTNWQI